MSPVIAPGGIVHARRATELAHRHDERFLVQTALDEVVDERRKGTIEWRQQQVRPFRRGIAIRRAMMVPRLRVDSDKRHPPFDQSSGEQRALAKLVPTIEVSHQLRFGADIERLTHLRSGQQVERRLIVLVEVPHRFIEFPAHRIERRHQMAAVA